MGADFFLHRLLDGDPASNTLRWRWVAGLQTAGKTYLARPDNIEKYTQGRFCPTGLATEAPSIAGAANPERGTLPAVDPIDRTLATGLLLHDEDLDLGHICSAGLNLKATAILPRQPTPPLFRDGA